MTEEFQYPAVRVGTSVEVSTDREFTSPRLGWIIDPKPGCADILYLRPNGAFGIVRSAKHRNDPTILTNPDWFDPDKGYPDSGVFQLADVEVRLGDLLREQSQIREMISILMRRVAVLETGTEPPSTPSEMAARRRPGRPRKDATPEFTGVG